MARYSVSLTIKENGRAVEERPLFDADEMQDVEEMVADIEDLVDEEGDGEDEEYDPEMAGDTED